MTLDADTQDKEDAYTTKSLHTGGGRGLLSGSGTWSSSDCWLVLLRPFPPSLPSIPPPSVLPAVRKIGKVRLCKLCRAHHSCVSSWCVGCR